MVNYFSRINNILIINDTNKISAIISSYNITEYNFSLIITFINNYLLRYLCTYTENTVMIIRQLILYFSGNEITSP